MGRQWFENTLLPKFSSVTITALLATLVLIFAFQADNITGRFFHVVLIAVPITLQVYFNAGLAYGLMKYLQGRACGRGAWRAHRGVEFLRAGGRNGHCLVRS